jgi:hypothetical protein
MNELTHEDVAFRLVRAMRLDTVMRDDDRLTLRAKVLWPSYAYDRADLNSQFENSIWLRQIEADAARRREWDNRPARNDYLEVMSWLVELLRLTETPLTEEQKKEALRLRSLGLHWRMIARRLGVAANAVARFFGIRRGVFEEEGSLSYAELSRRVALDWDWDSIGRADQSDAATAKRRWAGMINVMTDIVNGGLGELYLAPGVLRVKGAPDVPALAEVG